MLNHTRNNCEACRQPRCLEPPPVPELLDRISELEDENANLRKLEETIQRNTRLFEALLLASRDAILLLTPELTIMRMIHSALNYSERDVLGQSLLAFLHPDDVGVFEKAWAGLLSGHAKTCLVECRALGPGDTVFFEKIQITDMLDDPCVQAIVLNIRRGREVSGRS
jgi:PAS domain-containing protein